MSRLKGRASLGSPVQSQDKYRGIQLRRLPCPREGSDCLGCSSGQSCRAAEAHGCALDQTGVLWDVPGA